MHITNTYFCVRLSDSIRSRWRSSISKVATGWTRQKRSSMPLRIQETFLFITAFRPALGSIQLTTNGHRQHFSKWLGDYVVNLTTVKVKNACSSTSTPPYAHGLKLGPNDSLIEGIIANSFSRFSFIFHYSIFCFIRSFCLILQHSSFSLLPHSFHLSVILPSLSPCKLTSYFLLLLFNSKLHRRLHVITPSLWRLISYLFLS